MSIVRVILRSIMMAAFDYTFICSFANGLGIFTSSIHFLVQKCMM